MTKFFQKRIALILFLAMAVCISTNAQERRATTRDAKKVDRAATLKRSTAKKRISAKDRQAIEALFKGVDPGKYRLQFYNGERRKASQLGRLNYKMNDLQRVQRITNPVDAVGWIVFVVEGDDVIYVLAVGSDKLKSVLGAQKVQRLNTIMAKYQ